MRIILATLPTYYEMAASLTKCNHEDRLLSFYLLDKLTDNHLRHYVETGLTLPKKKRKPKKVDYDSNKYQRERRLALAKRIQAYEKEEIELEEI